MMRLRRFLFGKQEADVEDQVDREGRVQPDQPIPEEPLDIEPVNHHEPDAPTQFVTPGDDVFRPL
jgi:hypothetical protein